jgi:hypothetical protein
MQWVPGKIVAGYGVASGRGSDRRYPAGSIALQAPFFLEKGIDLSPYFAGTLNVDLAPFDPQPLRPLFDGRLRWFGDLEERFLLSSIEIRVKGRQLAGLWYYPHPETKPAHFQKTSVVELLLPWIEGAGAGEPVEVRL